MLRFDARDDIEKHEALMRDLDGASIACLRKTDLEEFRKTSLVRGICDPVVDSKPSQEMTDIPDSTSSGACSAPRSKYSNVALSCLQ